MSKVFFIYLIFLCVCFINKDKLTHSGETVSLENRSQASCSSFSSEKSVLFTIRDNMENAVICKKMRFPAQKSIQGNSYKIYVPDKMGIAAPYKCHNGYIPPGYGITFNRLGKDIHFLGKMLI